jgi:hypothetical protein
MLCPLRKNSVCALVLREWPQDSSRLPAVISFRGERQAQMNQKQEQKPTVKYSVEARWTSKLARRFCPVSSFFLQNYHRLQLQRGARGMNSTEAMLIVQILDHKWTDKAPFPATGTLAKRMGLTPRAVRSALQSLDAGGFVRRELRSNGKTNFFYFDGLFKRLEELMEADQPNGPAPEPANENGKKEVA